MGLKFNLKKVAAVACAFTVMASTVYVGQPVAAATENISYEVSGDTKTVGGAFQIAVKVNGVSDLYGYGLDFTYDSNLMEVTSVTNGSVLSDATAPTVPSTSAGTVSFAATKTGATSGVTANGTLAIINAKVKAAGTLSLNANSLKLKLSNSNATAISATQASETVKLGNDNPDPVVKYSTITNFTASKVKNIAVNEAVTFKATADKSDTLYEFYTKEGTGAWTKQQAFSSSNTFTFKPTVKGQYQVKVYAKNATSDKKYDDTAALNFVVSVNANASSSTITGFKASQNLGIVGQPVTFTTTTTNQEDTLFEYYVLENGAWTRPQAFSYNNTFSWTPAKAGVYKVRVFAKNVNSAKKSDGYKDMTLTVIAPVGDYSMIESLTADKTSAAVGSTFNFTATATPADKTVYQFYVLIDGKWTLGQNWSANNTFSYKPTAAGTYKVRCFVKHVNSTEKNNGQLDLVFTAK